MVTSFSFQISPDHYFRLGVTKVGLIASILGVGISNLGTAYVSNVTLPWHILVWRFLAGLSSSYGIVSVPKWVDKRVDQVDRSRVTALCLTMGIIGSVLGYSLVVFMPQIGYVWLVATGVTPSQDFRKPFLYAAEICFLGALIFAWAVPYQAVHDRDSSTVYRSTSYEDLNRLGSTRVSPRVLRNLCMYPGFRWLASGIAGLMVLANAVSYWLFCYFKNTFDLSDAWACLFTGIVIVGGTGSGMNFPPRFDTDPPYRNFAIYSCLGSLFASAFVFWPNTNAYITTALLSVTTYFGSAVIPAAQASLSLHVPGE